MTFAEVQHKLSQGLEQAAHSEGVEIDSDSKIYAIASVTIKEGGRKSKRVAGPSKGKVFTLQEPFDNDLPASTWLGEE